MLRPLVVLAGTSLVLAACNDASGCSGFNPTSDPMEVGESQEIEVEIVDGGWGRVDADDGYWTTEDVPVPAGAEDGDVLHGTAMDTGAELRVDFEGHGTVTFPGPNGCE